MANRDELALIRGARAGQAPAQLALGKLYLFGSAGLPKSMATALHWLDRAARQDAQEAWLLIGTHISFDAAAQFEQPMQLCVWYERAFDAGVAQAGLVLAKLVLGQEDAAVGPDLQRKALKALSMAAQAGLADAQWLLAQSRAAQSGGPDASAEQRLTAYASGANGASGALERGDGAPAVPTDSNVLDWTARAADGGVVQAQYALAENAWIKSDWAVFLRWALPLARSLVQRAEAALPVASADEGALTRADVVLLSRCAQILSNAGLYSLAMEYAAADPEEIQRFWELAAQQDDRIAQLALGLWFARMDADGVRTVAGPGSANFKKAIRWLNLAGEQGLAEAWYALSRIYLKPEFSQRSVTDAQDYLERAAQLGHCAAQLECGSNAWRTRREDEANDVRAAYWLQKAAAQGSTEAAALLEKIAPGAMPSPWAEAARQQLTREMVSTYPFVAGRVELATFFQLSRAEALLLDLNAADQGHCLVVDIRAHYGRSRRHLILLQTAQERNVLDRITRLFDDVDCGPTGPEGNYRQRLYRLKTLLPDVGDT
jgi:TPR repeat protein